MEYEETNILICKGKFIITDFIKNNLDILNIDFKKLDLIEQRTNKTIIDLFYKYPVEFKNCYIYTIPKKYEKCFIIYSYSNDFYEQVIILEEYYSLQADHNFLTTEKKMLLNKIKIIDNLLQFK